MIAASIVFVALQNVFWPGQKPGTARLGVAFFFGLFHGLGFAGGLLDAMSGMPGVAVEPGHSFVQLSGWKSATNASSFHFSA